MYFASTDLARSVVETLRGYGGRWSCEVVNFYTKTQLGLAVRSQITSWFRRTFSIPALG